MMNVRIGKFKIISDATQFTLIREQVTGPESKNPGEKVDIPLGYYSTIEAVLEAVPKKALMRSDATTLAECIQIIRDYKRLIRKAMNPEC